MIDRIFIALLIMVTLYLLYKLSHRSQLQTAQHKALSIERQQENQLLYFSSPACSQCEGQEKILKQVFNDTRFMQIRLSKYSIEDNLSLAKQWGVKTLPTTILLSRSGKVKKINNGLISSNELLRQLNDLKAASI